MTPNDKLDLQVSEEQDGSAVVKMPAGESPDDNRNDTGDDKTLSNIDDDNDDDDGDDGSVDPEREAIREARREERKLKK